jgi:folate-binding protein YgfZ
MPTQALPSDCTIALEDRRLIRVSGADAASFLQNVMTNDIALTDAGGLAYSCLLTPQGQYLHDFFVLREDAQSYLVDIDAAQAGDFLRRMAVFKLRAKAGLEILDPAAHAVYATTDIGIEDALADPRHHALPRRLYAAKAYPATHGLSLYNDLCIGLGIPPAAALTPRDTVADVNLDLLNAVGWEKGCFIGQEVTARMRYRGLAKKRLLIVAAGEGQRLQAGQEIRARDAVMGDVRLADSTGLHGLAVVRLAALSDGTPQPLAAGGHAISLKSPDYLVFPAEKADSPA